MVSPFWVNHFNSRRRRFALPRFAMVAVDQTFEMIAAMSRRVNNARSPVQVTSRDSNSGRLSIDDDPDLVRKFAANAVLVVGGADEVIDSA